jgi:F-type H+-transporting ATPase subunit b
MTGWWTFGLQIANFLALVWLLHRFLYRRVLATLAERRKRADETTARVATAQAAADQARASVDAEHAGLLAERDRLIDAARTKAVVERDELLAKARVDADQIVTAARSALADERAAALADLKAHATELAIQIAARLLGELDSASIDDAFLSRVETYLDALPVERARGLIAEAAGGVEIVTTHPLVPESAARWRERLGRRFGATSALTFSIDPSLLAGAELHFRSAVVRLSWRDELGHTAEALRGHAVAG